MVDDVLSIDPGARIFHVRGAFFAGWQPMDRASVPIDVSDLVLLSAVHSANGQSELVATARDRIRTNLLQSWTRIQTKSRISELQQAGVLVRGGCAARSDPVGYAPVELKQFSEGTAKSEALYERPLRLSHNFMLRAVPNGFQIRSSVSGRYEILALDLALVLVAFSSGKSVGRVIAERKETGDKSQLLRAIEWLKSRGLLVSAQEEQAHWNQSAVSCRQSKQEQGSDRPGDSSKLNGRIPIYFVPHMPNHYPLALGMMYSFIANYDGGRLLERYMPVPIVYLETPADMLTGPYGRYGPGIWLFSNYMWSVVKNLAVSAAVKRHDPRNITVHGGPSTPSYEVACSKFMMEHKSVDIAVHGEGEVTLVELLDALKTGAAAFEALDAVNGLTFRKRSIDGAGLERDALTRTAPRARIQDLDMLPSPYLSGSFDTYGGAIDAAIIESNRGCPFGCTFCDWGSATNQRIRKFDLQRVKKEIDWIGRRQVRVIWIADANFGIYDRDIEIAEWICAAKERYGYPKEVVVNYTKNATRRLAKIVKLLASSNICSQGVISIQTRDKSTLEVVNRKNIKSETYDDLAEIFRSERLPLSTDLMIGLPGMTVESFKEDLQYFFDMDITVKAYPTQLLPNSPMADPAYMEKYEIEVDENDFLTSTFSYSPDDLHEMNVIYSLFTIADSFSVLRYVLRYLRWDHGIKALDFLHTLRNRIDDDLYRYPAIAFVARAFQHYMLVPGGWRDFYDEIADFAGTTFGVQRGSAFNAVLKFNELVMPDDALTYPLTAKLRHDVSTYFLEHNSKPVQGGKPLHHYPPAEIIIEDKYRYGHIDYNSKQYDSHQMFWELQSPASRTQSVPNFV